ncbi:MAG TPA: FAD/NAD(P)-binding protein [Spirochaetia bacterium]|nr:FAD/NAD(P)-binding protein [Spirochaetia bacterium]
MKRPDLQLLIIGGGVQGTFLSHAIQQWTGLSRNAIRVLDPHGEPLANWHAQTASCGMKYLRSPSSHNMDVDFRALRRWARSQPESAQFKFLEPYTRPSLPLFNSHARTVIEEHSLTELRVCGRATRISLNPHGAEVTCTDGKNTFALSSRLVLLALSRTEMLRYPEWAPPLIAQGAPVRHIFAAPSGAELAKGKVSGKIVVLGGGITSAQVALSVHEKSGSVVTLVCDDEPRVRMFDSNPGYIGPKYLPSFRAIGNYEARRAVLKRERYPGSMPPYVHAELDAAIGEGRIERIIGRVHEASCTEGCVRLMVQETSSADGAGGTIPKVIEAASVYLATGFRTERPGGTLVDDLIEEYGLPVAQCGYPITGRDLFWGSGIYTAGALAELELGPASLNIIGAHSAGRLISRTLRSRLG